VGPAPLEASGRDGWSIAPFLGDFAQDALARTLWNAQRTLWVPTIRFAFDRGGAALA